MSFSVYVQEFFFREGEWWEGSAQLTTTALIKG